MDSRKKRSIQYSRKALKGLEEVATYLTDNFGVDKAPVHYAELIRRIEMLCDNPHLGRPFPNPKDNCWGFLAHRNIKVYYHFNTEKIIIDLVWNTWQDPQKLFKQLKIQLQ